MLLARPAQGSMQGRKTASALGPTEVQLCRCNLNLLGHSLGNEANGGTLSMQYNQLPAWKMCVAIEKLVYDPFYILMSRHKMPMTPAITLPSEGSASAMAKLDVPVNMPTSKTVLAPVSLTRDFRKDPSNDPAQHSFF